MLNAPDTCGAWKAQNVCIYENLSIHIHLYPVPGWYLLQSSLLMYLSLRKAQGKMLSTCSFYMFIYLQRIRQDMNGVQGNAFVPAQDLGDRGIKFFYSHLWTDIAGQAPQSRRSLNSVTLPSSPAPIVRISLHSLERLKATITTTTLPPKALHQQFSIFLML